MADDNQQQQQQPVSLEIDDDIFNTSTGPDPESISALDALHAEAVKSRSGGDEPDPKVDDDEPPKKEDDEPPKKESDDDIQVKPKSDDDTPLKPDDPKPEEGSDPKPPGTDDPLGDITLPEEAKPKSHEAFAQVKQWAKDEVAKRDTEIETLKSKITELEARPEIPEELNKEVQDLRKFRASFDVELDPRFQEYDKKVTRADYFSFHDR